jgi:hypothetical protein
LARYASKSRDRKVYLNLRARRGQFEARMNMPPSPTFPECPAS